MSNSYSYEQALKRASKKNSCRDDSMNFYLKIPDNITGYSHIDMYELEDVFSGNVRSKNYDHLMTQKMI